MTTTTKNIEDKKTAVKKAKILDNEKSIKLEQVEEKIENIENIDNKTEEISDTENKEEIIDADKTKKIAYYYAIGRRKSAIAQARLYKKGEGEIKINEKDFKTYFPREEWQSIISAPLVAMGQTNKLNVFIKTQGGGIKSQAEAIRLAIARALLKLNPIFKRGLKKYGYLTRDSRIKERKKYGLKSARRAPQWQKR